MSLGLNPVKADVDYLAGTLAKRLHEDIDRIGEFKYWLDGKSVGDLEALGYTNGEANLLKSVFADLDQLRTLYVGAATLGSVKDFRTFARQIIGFGLSLPGN